MEQITMEPLSPNEGAASRAVLSIKLAALQLTKDDLTSATFTLYDRGTLRVVNERNKVHVLQYVSAQAELGSETPKPRATSIL